MFNIKRKIALRKRRKSMEENNETSICGICSYCGYDPNTEESYCPECGKKRVMVNWQDGYDLWGNKIDSWDAKEAVRKLQKQQDEVMSEYAKEKERSKSNWLKRLASCMAVP